ncbi:MAG: SRPBCC family protein [Nocardioidaceae bacterium]
MTLSRTVQVDKPISSVYAYLSDFTTSEEWDAGTVRTTRVSGDGSVGTTYANTSRFFGRESDLTYVITALEPETKIALRGENKTVVANDTIVLSGDEHHTQVVYTAQFEFQGFVKYLEPLLTLPMKRFGDDAQASLQQALQKL